MHTTKPNIVVGKFYPIPQPLDFFYYKDNMIFPKLKSLTCPQTFPQTSVNMALTESRHTLLKSPFSSLYRLTFKIGI